VTNIYQQKVRPVPMRAGDSLTEGVLRLFCLGLHRDAWIGQKHQRASTPSQERISATSATSALNEDRSLRGGQERDRENAGGRVYLAVQICRVDFQHCTCTEEGWPVASLHGFQGPQQSHTEG
jgi:hypothetical protein